MASGFIDDDDIIDVDELIEMDDSTETPGLKLIGSQQQNLKRKIEDYLDRKRLKEEYGFIDDF